MTQIITMAWSRFNPMDSSMPVFPVFHYLQEFAQTHVHSVSDAIQPSHPLLPPSPPALKLSQHQGLYQWVGSQIRWPKYWSFRFSITPSNEYSGLIYFRINWFDLLVVQGLSRIFSSITIWKNKFFDPQSSLQSNHLICTWLLGKKKKT